MLQSLYFAAPLVVLALVLLLACAGCGLDATGTGVALLYEDQVKSNASLVGYWRLNEPGGSVAADSAAAAAHHGTYVTGALAAAPPSAAAPGELLFNQSPPVISNSSDKPVKVNGARVEVPLTAELKTPKFTFVAWVRPQWPPADVGFVRAVASTRVSSGAENGWSLAANAANQWEANICNGTTHATINTGSAFTFTTDFLALTYDGTTFRLFVNVEERGSVASAYVPGTVAKLYIGEGRPDLPAPLFPFNGLIGEVAYFKEALAPQDLMNLMVAASR